MSFLSRQARLDRKASLRKMLFESRVGDQFRECPSTTSSIDANPRKSRSRSSGSSNHSSPWRGAWQLRPCWGHRLRERYQSWGCQQTSWLRRVRSDHMTMTTHSQRHGRPSSLGSTQSSSSRRYEQAKPKFRRVELEEVAVTFRPATGFEIVAKRVDCPPLDF